jgi:cytochrome c5
LILFPVHIKMEFDWFESFEYLFKKVSGRVGVSAPTATIAGGLARVRIPRKHFSAYPALIAGFIAILSFGISVSQANSRAQDVTAPGVALLGASVHRVHALPAEAPRPAAPQDSGQAAPPAAAPSAPKPVELPEGDGKPIATEYCQMCHKLTNLTKAHKNLDDWKDTIQTMIERGASIPDDKTDTLAKYLAANFGPKDAAAPTNAQAGAPAAPVASSDPAPPGAPAPAAAKAVVELPEGDGKAIATENCQACHKLTNLTKAHKNLDDWKETVQTMIDRGANVPAEQVDTLVQYLAKNFGPKDASAPASAAPPSSTPAQ